MCSFNRVTGLNHQLQGGMFDLSAPADIAAEASQTVKWINVELKWNILSYRVDGSHSDRDTKASTRAQIGTAHIHRLLVIRPPAPHILARYSYLSWNIGVGMTSQKTEKGKMSCCWQLNSRTLISTKKIGQRIAALFTCHPKWRDLIKPVSVTTDSRVKLIKSPRLNAYMARVSIFRGHFASKHTILSCVTVPAYACRQSKGDPDG